MDLVNARRQKWCTVHGQESYVSESKKPLTVFTKFPQLPAEIRLRIWNFMLPPAGVVHLRFEEPGRLYLSPSLPVTLKINRESRAESIAQLTPTDDSHLGKSQPSLGYFFSTLDTVSVDKHSLGGISFSFFFWHVQNVIGQEGLLQMRSLAIEDVVWNSLNARNSKPPDWEDWVLKLDKFIIFHKENPNDAMNDLELSEPPRSQRELGLERRQVHEKFMQYLPNSSSSQMPKIHLLVARPKASLTLPALPSPTLSEVYALDELGATMQGLNLS